MTKLLIRTFLILGIFMHTKALLVSQFCNLPVLSNISDPTVEGFSISWLDFNQNIDSWEIEFGKKAFTRTFSPNISNIQSSNYVFDGLNSGTTYEIYIRTVCVLGILSDWNGPYFYNTIIDNENACNLSLAIPDNNCPINSEYLIEINGFEGLVIGRDLTLENVLMSIEHTWPPDLRIHLVSPKGTAALLSSHNGNGVDNYGNPDNACMSNAIFSDKACISVTDWPPPYIGTFKAEDELALTFNEEEANGIWKLIICDRADGDLGTLNFINLEFSEKICQTPQDFIIYDIEGTSATFKWRSFDNCDQIKMVYKEINAPPQEVFIDFIECSKEEFIATGLQPSGQYTLTVTSQCTDNLISEPICELSFVTSCTNSTVSNFFDSDDICELNCDTICILSGIWQNENTSDGLSWFIGSAETNTEFTGPSGDKNINGQYLFIESSLNCVNGATANLSSSCLSIEGNENCAISFYYHMFGNETGTLKLQYSENEYDWTTFWEQSGDQSDTWLFEQLDISDSNIHGRIRFRAETLPNANRGDVAIDHVKLYGAEEIELTAYFLDSDLDGFGNPDTMIWVCSNQSIVGLSRNALDCDDQNNLVNPVATELACNLIDDNCNGLIDDAEFTGIEYEVVSVVNEECKGIKNGSIEIQTTLGTGPFKYLWSNGDKNRIATNLSFGVYSCVIMDSDSCRIETSPIVVGFDNLLVYSVSELNASTCNGALDGLITLIVAGGQAPYDVQWSDGQSGLSIASLKAGFYEATITSADGCVATTTKIEVTGNQVLTTGIALKNNIDCFGEKTGLIQLGVFGGRPPYSFSWNNGATTNLIRNLSAGDYDVTITDSNGCFHVINDINISQPDALSVNLNNIDNVTCPGGRNASIDISVFGGTAPYSYFWSDGSFSQDLFQKAAGRYSLTVTDFKACTGQISNIEIKEPDDFKISSTQIINVPCSGSAEGLIRVNVEGGTPPYLYNWSNSDGMSTSDHQINTLLPGQYFVTIVDQFGCKSLPGKFEVINQNKPISITLLQQDLVKCFNEANASILAVCNSDHFPIDYNWSAGRKIIRNIGADTLREISAGKYNITITDDEGCVGVSDSLKISNPPELTYEVLNIVNNLCWNEDEGAIRLAIFGGTGAKNILWNNDTDDLENSNLGNGIYWAEISDKNGCSILTENIPILSPDPIIINASITSANASVNGMISLSATGGLGPYTYHWAPPFEATTDSILLNVPSGFYAVTLEDKNECHLDTILEVPFISPTIDIEYDQVVKIFPNPTSSHIHFDFDHNWRDISVSIYQLNGKKIYTQKILVNQSIDLSSLSKSGILILDIRHDKFRQISKIVILQ